MSERKVCIVGCGALEENLPSGYEIWVVNDCWRSLSRYDRLYELHRPTDRPWRPQRHWRHLRRPTGELWTMYADKRWPKAHIYPVQDVLYRWRPYHTCSFTWMIAHALLEGLTHLALFGVNLETVHERHYERPAVEYWCGIAEASGVHLLLEPRQPLLQAPFLYALQDTAWSHASLYYSRVSATLHRIQAQEAGTLNSYERYLETGVWSPHTE